jgi:hypothetical protein
MAERLTIAVTAGGDGADARAFGAVLGDVLDLLDAIATQRAGREIRINWKIISLQKRSPAKITIANTTAVLTVALLMSGLSAIESGKTQPFSTPGMKIARRLGDRIGREASLVVLHAPKSRTREVKLTSDLAINAAVSIQNGFYEMPSSVDGKLDIVNVHNGPKFSIFDDVLGREVRCRFADALLETVKGNLGKRVTAEGIVRFKSATDQPISIRVESIEPLEDSEAPKLFGEMPAINVSGNVAPEKYIRELRDGR